MRASDACICYNCPDSRLFFLFFSTFKDNFFLNIANHAAHASKSPLPGQVDVNQTEFERIALAQVTELWTNYGQLGEIVRDCKRV